MKNNRAVSCWEERDGKRREVLLLSGLDVKSRQLSSGELGAAAWAGFLYEEGMPSIRANRVKTLG